MEKISAKEARSMQPGRQPSHITLAVRDLKKGEALRVSYDEILQLYKGVMSLRSTLYDYSRRNGNKYKVSMFKVVDGDGKRWVVIIKK